ncbi:MAG: hypothetical protein FJ396_09475 [Verrucomicrobia bacterium]|nr:hypothetical protein [Verrucomicrobiota bacterium]
MRTARIVLAAMVIFAAGVLTGSVGAGLVGRLWRSHAAVDGASPVAVAAPEPARSHAPSNAPAGSLARPPGWAQIEAMARWSRELELEASQRQRIDAILESAGGRLRALWEPVAPRTRAEIDAARREIEQTLTPEQRLRWNEVRRRRAAPKPAPAP